MFARLSGTPKTDAIEDDGYDADGPRPGLVADLRGNESLDVAGAKCQAQVRRRTSHVSIRSGPAGAGLAGCGPAGRRGAQAGKPSKETAVTVYRVTEVIGTSSTSWEDAAAEAIRTAAGTIRDLRVAEVVKQDIHLDEGGAITYRTKLQLSFKYESEH
jgi:dodecin